MLKLYLTMHMFQYVLYMNIDIYRNSLFVETSSDVKDRHPAWGKLSIMSKYLAGENTFDWVVWTDCDTFFMNHKIPLAALFTKSVLQQSANHWGIDSRLPDLIVSEDGNMVNTGFFAMRPTDWSRNFLKSAFDEQFSVFSDHPWWEQASIHFLLETMHTPKRSGLESGSFHNHVALVPQELVNPYPSEYSNAVHKHYQPGSFIIAFSGCNTYTDEGMSLDNCNKLYEHYARLAG